MNKKLIAAGVLALSGIICTAAVIIQHHNRVALRNDILSQISGETVVSENEEYPFYEVTGYDFISMYANSSLESEEINRVYPGSIVEFMGDAGEGFAYIRGKGSSQAGYVLKEFLEPCDFVYSFADIDVVDTDTGIYSYDEMINDISAIEQQYPETVKSTVIGQTAEAHDIYMLSLGNAPRRILVYGAMNGTDYTATQLLMKQIEYYAHYMNEGSFHGYRYSDLFANIGFDIIPMVNPDGVSINQWGPDSITDEKIRDLVKNTFYTDHANNYTNNVKTTYFSTWKANANGVDLNMNFPTGFEEQPLLKASSHAGYRGVSPLSENETKAMSRLIESGSYFAVIGYTAEGNSISYAGDNSGELAWLISGPAHYDINANTGAGGRGGSLLLFCEANGISAVEIGLSDKTAPLTANDLQDPWIKLRELFVIVSAYYLNG